MKDDNTIVVFTCNWEAYSGLEAAGRKRMTTPAAVHPVKVMCLGRISPGVILSAFQLGAAGVMLAGCPPENCRYEFGVGVSEGAFTVARELVRRLGFADRRIQMHHVAAGDGDAWARIIGEFADSIAEEPLPFRFTQPAPPKPGAQETRQALRNIVDSNQAWYCVDCGKCSSACPVTPWEDRSFSSPRFLVEKAVNGHLNELFDDPLFWSCTTCQRCSQICPSTVPFTAFIRDVRSLARRNGRQGACTHGAVIQAWGRMMAEVDFGLKRLAWLDDSLRISQDSDILYFVGCIPFYDVLFRHLDIEGIEVAKAAIRILNALGITPQVLSDERCCGHDQLWEGDLETFRALAERNLEQILKSGAKTIVTTCPECARTLSLDYPEHTETHGLEVLHLTQFLSRRLSKTQSAAHPKPGDLTATFQDACRLGRHLGVYAAPRALISAADIALVEMERSHQSGVCCGTSGWTDCGRVCKSIQVDRLKEAKATNAELLITTCIKCQIHLKCAQMDPELKPEIDLTIRDVTTVLADRIGRWRSSINLKDRC